MYAPEIETTYAELEQEAADAATPRRRALRERVPVADVRWEPPPATCFLDP
jgi:hypothetical protein